MQQTGDSFIIIAHLCMLVHLHKKYVIQIWMRVISGGQTHNFLHPLICDVPQTHNKSCFPWFHLNEEHDCVPTTEHDQTAHLTTCSTGLNMTAQQLRERLRSNIKHLWSCSLHVLSSLAFCHEIGCTQKNVNKLCSFSQSHVFARPLLRWSLKCRHVEIWLEDADDSVAVQQISKASSFIWLLCAFEHDNATCALWTQRWTRVKWIHDPLFKSATSLTPALKLSVNLPSCAVCQLTY